MGSQCSRVIKQVFYPLINQSKDVVDSTTRNKKQNKLTVTRDSRAVMRHGSVPMKIGLKV